MEEKRCENCTYLRYQEEYWHDHYLIREHYYCVRGGYYHEKDVDPKDSCKEFRPREFKAN